jgi:hypothetical protein
MNFIFVKLESRYDKTGRTIYDFQDNSNTVSHKLWHQTMLHDAVMEYLIVYSNRLAG